MADLDEVFTEHLRKSIIKNSKPSGPKGFIPDAVDDETHDVQLVKPKRLSMMEMAAALNQQDSNQQSPPKKRNSTKSISPKADPKNWANHPITYKRLSYKIHANQGFG